MPNDIADWTSAVNVQAGSITISGTPTVLVSGTVAVSITGANVVVLGGGTASIGSISAIDSTVTVAGTVNIGNTPAVTISGTPTVNINSGTVSISGTPSINILSQSVTVNVNSPGTALDNQTTAANTAATYGPYTLPAGTHAIGLVLTNQAAAFLIQGNTTGQSYGVYGVQGNGNILPAGYYVIPVSQASDTQIKLLLWTPAGNAIHWYLSAILDSQVVQLDASTYDFATQNPIVTIGGSDINKIPRALSVFTQYPSTFNPMVVMPTSLTADAQAGKLALAPFDFTVNNGNTGQLVASSNGNKIYLYAFQWTSTAALPFYWELQDMAGNDFARFGGGTQGERYVFPGTPGALNQGLQVKNISGVAQRIAGVAHYIQAP